MESRHANYLCSHNGITPLGLHNVAPPSDGAFDRLGVSEKQLASIDEQLKETLDAAKTLASI